MKRRNTRTSGILLLLGLVPSSGFLTTTPISRSRLSTSLAEEHEENTNISSFQPCIVYESDRILAIHKPPGISHHDDPLEGTLGIISLLRRHGRPEDERLFGVHRLDRVTSGILLLAKDAEMAALLTQAFREQRVTKYYVGISSRRGRKKQGWVRGEMVRGRRKSWYLSSSASTTNNDGGGNAKSNYAVTRFFQAGLGSISDEHASPLQQGIQAKACLLFRPMTGKTHQLRVAAKSLGMPLVGDPIYRTNDSPTNSEVRTFLHAAAISISFPDNNSLVSIWCPPPFGSLLWDDTGAEEFSQIVESLFRKHCDCPEILNAIQGYSLVADERE